MKIQQKQDGQAGQGSTVDGIDHVAQSGSINHPGRGMGSTPTPWPFKVYDVTIGSTAQIAVNSIPGGTGNALQSDGITPMINAVSVSGALNGVVTGTGQVWINCTLDQNQTVTMVAVAWGATMPAQPTGPNPSNAYQLIGTYNVTFPSPGVASAGVSNTTSNGYTGLLYCGQNPIFY